MTLKFIGLTFHVMHYIVASMETMLPNDNNVTSYEDVRLEGQVALKNSILNAALHVLAEEGVEAVTVRHIAQTLGCSTKVIYTNFGSKGGLTESLYLEGFKQLRDQLSQVELGDNPRTYFRSLGNVYWDFAQQNPHLYGIMFGSIFSKYRPDDAGLLATQEVLVIVVSAIETFARKTQGRVIERNAGIAAKSLWASLHGVISLQLTGRFPNDATGRQLFNHTIEMLLDALFLDPESSQSGA